MSFKVFIYYCAVLGGWAAFLTWAVNQSPGAQNMTNTYLKTGLIAGLLGFLVAATVGGLDAVLNASGKERMTRISICAGAGLLAGLVGGLVGQRLADTRESLRVVGWVIVGTAIGGSIGIYDMMIASGQSLAPRKKVINGILGGSVGGLVGGLLSDLLPRVFHGLPRTALALGLLLLGLSIGLFIGLAQVFLKEAWLKVEEGFRAGREIMLTKDETTIGRAESCDIGMFGDSAVERLHARIKLQSNHYLLEDAGTPLGTFLNHQRIARATPLHNGDMIKIGNCVLRFGERAKKE